MSLRKTPTLKSLEVILDASLMMDAQVTNVVKLLFFQLCQARQLTSFISHPKLASVIYAAVTYTLDCSNLLYMGLPVRLTQKFQLVQSAVEKILIETLCTAHIHPVLCELHWLPEEYWIHFNVLVLTSKALNGQEPKCVQTGPLGQLEAVLGQLPFRPSTWAGGLQPAQSSHPHGFWSRSKRFQLLRRLRPCPSTCR